MVCVALYRAAVYRAIYWIAYIDAFVHTLRIHAAVYAYVSPWLITGH